jgi:hypothetical protein
MTLADHAVPGHTPRDQPEGPLALPGQYTIEVSVDGRIDRQTLVIKADPRMRATAADVEMQFALGIRLVDALSVSYDSFMSLKTARATVSDRLRSLNDVRTGKDLNNRNNLIKAVQDFDKKLDAVQTGTTGAPGVGVANRDLARYYQMLTGGDGRPADRLRTAAMESCQGLAKALDAWRQLNATDLPALNKRLAVVKQSPLEALPVPAAPACAP